MTSNRPLPLFASADVQKHVSPKDCWVTLYHRKVYNVTEFLEEHPAGDDLILEYAGKDITQIMGDQLSHIHSESAYEMLDEDMLVGYLATPEEERELLSNKDHEVEVQLDSKGNVVEVDIDLTEFGELPAEGLLSLKTDYEHDLVKHQFLDLNRPLLMQVLRGSWTKEFYLDQVHRPRHYGKGSAPLFGNFLEPLSMTAWWIVPMVWLPVNFYFFYIGFTNQNKLVAMAFWLLGLFVWTFLEYALHRFLFHLDYYLPENQIAFTIHFLLHGIHHYLPMDKYRLVMPPTLFIVLCYPIKTLVFSVLPYYMACSGFAG